MSILWLRSSTPVNLPKRNENVWLKLCIRMFRTASCTEPNAHRDKNEKLSWTSDVSWDNYSFSLTSVLWLGLVNERGGVLGDRSAGRRRVWGIFPFPSLLWHYGLGSNVSLRCPLRGVFLDSTEYSFSEANRGHTWSQSTQKNVRQETQQRSVRYPSSIGVFAAVHVITV